MRHDLQNGASWAKSLGRPGRSPDSCHRQRALAPTLLAADLAASDREHGLFRSTEYTAQ